MKILITTDWYKPAINGVVTSVINLTDELIKNGHDVRILTLSRSINSYKEANVYYIKSIPFYIYPEVRASVLLFDELLDELVAWRPDVIHSQCEFFTYTYGKIIAKRSNAPIVHTYHTMYEDYSDYLKIKKEIGRSIVAFMSKNRLRDATVVIAPTNKVRRKLKSYNITKEIKVIPSGLNLSNYDIDFSDEDKADFKCKHGISLDSNILLYLGRIGKEKGLSELVFSFKLLLKEREDVVLVIVGGGPYEEALIKEIKKLGLEDKIKMIGMVAPEIVPYFYKSADIFVSASQSETQGLTYIEAMSNGLPQVCKYDECLDNVLIDSYNGLFYKTPLDFKDKINVILDNKELKESMRINALKKGKTFSKEFFADSIINVYRLAIMMNINKPRKINFDLEHIAGIFNVNDYISRRFGNRN